MFTRQHSNIIPAILSKKWDDFEKQAQTLSNKFPTIQIDVMDGIFVPNKSFADIEKINNLDLPINWELHLMVAHPLAEIEKWQDIKNIKRVIFQIESQDDPQAVIAAIRRNCWQVGVAINPETPITAINAILEQIDEVLFLTVHPGQQGAQFLPEVVEKIQHFHQELQAKNNQHITIAADGGINDQNISSLQDAGVENFCVGSAISKFF